MGRSGWNRRLPNYFRLEEGFVHATISDKNLETFCNIALPFLSFLLFSMLLFEPRNFEITSQYCRVVWGVLRIFGEDCRS